ncbi:hypothetical protein CRG98_043476 [Punica granatum]|uniref:Uncharacterized protein n=1 Tax=Punica granatum TaxID=22663 RepID=A0A2I0HWR4_PUNGR|nr:hypothetical protein CRG98_043476 [Punica granatum]
MRHTTITQQQQRQPAGGGRPDVQKQKMVMLIKELESCWYLIELAVRKTKLIEEAKDEEVSKGADQELGSARGRKGKMKKKHPRSIAADGLMEWWMIKCPEEGRWMDERWIFGHVDRPGLDEQKEWLSVVADQRGSWLQGMDRS